mmetsp:Transcript_20776/g.44949  ORF Transcript_20776/g.44949 Transcript_20776/m.44949 type:complete len:92 (+) Transcript_20776:256-531(+)
MIQEEDGRKYRKSNDQDEKLDRSLRTAPVRTLSEGISFGEDEHSSKCVSPVHAMNERAHAASYSREYINALHCSSSMGRIALPQTLSDRII